jgi:hypothetical protein
MSILDIANKFSDGQAITVTAVSDKTLDQLAAGDSAHPLWLVVRAKVALDSVNHTATLQVKVRTSAGVDGNNALNGTITELVLSPVLTAPIAANATIFKVKIPRGSKRYVALQYVNGVEAFNAGSVDAFLTPNPEGVGQMLRPSGDPA